MRLFRDYRQIRCSPSVLLCEALTQTKPSSGLAGWYPENHSCRVMPAATPVWSEQPWQPSLQTRYSPRQTMDE